MLRRLALAFIWFFRILFGKPIPGAPGIDARVAPELAAPAESEAARASDRAAGAVTALSLLQRDGRLIDFLLEDISTYEDAQVGAAVREVHRACRSALDEHFDFRPVMDGEEGAEVTVDAGFDASAIRLTGDVSGEPPFSGKLRHAGWRATRVDLPPAAPDGVVAPAEVEL